MRAFIIVLGAALAVAACSKSNDQNNAEMNNLSATDPNAANMMATDQNAALGNGPGGVDMNTATNASTENKMAKDMNTNDKDTNLSNGM